MVWHPCAREMRVRVFSKLLIAVALLTTVVLPAAAQQAPYWNGGSGPMVNYDPVPWPTDAQWVAYTRNNDSINDQRTQDPSNGGTSPQAYVNVASGCSDQALPSVYYYYDAARQVIFYRWRVENGPNNYGTGPSPGSFGATNPWNSGQWTVLFDLNGDGFRDFAVHLNGSTGAPSTPIDMLNSIWSPTLSNTLDYINDPSNVHLLHSNPTAFIDTNNQIIQFDGTGNPATVQWPRGSSETVWDYGTTRATDISTTTCREYWVDYQIPLAMLDASAFGGPVLTPTTPFSFMFATANSLNNPFQKDIVLDGVYVCPPTAPAPFGDPMTLQYGILEQAIATSITAGAGSCAAVPLKGQILDSLQITNCSTVSTLVSASFQYYYDANGNGEDDDGGTWTSIPATLTGTTVTANWDTSTLIRGQYLVALELEDSFGHTTRTWIEDFEAVPGSIYTNFPNDGLGSTQGVNYAKVIVGPPCGAPPPSMTKVASTAQVQGGGAMSYTLTITNTSSNVVTVSSISDTLPAGFAYVSNGAGTLGAPSSSPAPGATGTITWSFPGGTTIPASSSRTFIFNVTAGTSQGTFYNTASAVTNFGTITAADTTGIQVRTATLTLAKSAALSTAPSVPVTSVPRGSTVRFTLTYSNTSNVAVTGAVLSDVLPPNFTYVTASPAPSSAPAVGANGTVTWNIGNVAANSGPFTVTVDAIATLAGSYTNTATLTSNEAPTVNASANLFVSGPLLAITKTASASSVVPTSNVDYTITFTNIGDATANITTVTDVVPVGHTLVVGAPTSAGCTQAGTTITCTVASTLAVGASATRVLRISVGPTAPDPSVNTATVNASNAPSASTTYSLAVTSNTCTTSTWYFHNTLANVSSSSTYSVAYASITSGGSGYVTAPTVSFSGGGGTGAAGTAVIYGGAVVGINITNAGSGYTTAPTISLTGGGGTGATATASLTNSQRTANNTAPVALTSSNIGPITVSTTPLELARFYSPVISTTHAYALSEILGATTANPIVRFYVNKTGAPQVQARVRLYAFDPATQATTLLATGFSDAISGNKTNEPGNVTSMPLEPTAILPAGNRLLWTFEFVSNNNDNQITFRFDSTGSNSFARVCMAPIRPSVTKTVDKATAVPGVDSLVYTITYSNPSTTSLPNVILTDVLPAGLTYTSASVVPTSAPAVGTNGTVTWNLGTLTGGASGTITLTVGTTSGMTASSVTNTASLTTFYTPAVQASATTFLRRPEVNVTKRASKTSLVPGESFTYTIDVVNAGTGTATGVVMTDPLPSHITTSATSTNIVSTVNITAGGTGYVTAPTATFTGGGGSGAAGTAIVSGGAVVGVTITSNGTGYTSAPTVGFTGGGGTGATATSAITALSVAGSNLTFSIGTMTAGQVATFVINAQVATTGVPAGVTALTNTASVTDSYNPSPRTSSAVVTVTATPVLTLVETATPSDRRVVYANVTAGGTYTDIPTVSFVGGGCTGVTGTVSVTGTPGNYSVTGVTITNPGTGCTSAPSIVFSGAGVGGASATATIGPAPGDTITYQLTATNTGNADATGVVIYDVIPNYTSWVSGGTFSIDTVRSTATTLTPGASTILTYTVVVGESLPKGVTPLTTNGGATSTNTAPPAPVTTTLNTGAAPAYSITKSPDDGVEPWPVATLNANAAATTTLSVASTRLVTVGSYIVVGSTVTKVTARTSTTITVDTPVTASSGTNILQAVEYTLVYSNDGNAAGTNVVVTDVLPANLGYAGIPTGYTAPTSAPAIGASGTITWNIGTLTNGGEGLLKFLAYATVAGVYTNTATISDGNTLNTYNDSDSATTTFGALDPVKITTTPSIINQAPTNIAHYEITVTNPLATPATNVAVIDNLSLGFTYRPGTTVINGVASSDPTSRYVSGIVLGAGGSGYTSTPTVTISGGGGTGATAKALVSGGVVTSIVIINAGYNYTSAPSVSITGGGGTGATATSILSNASSSPQWAGLSIPGNGTLTIAFDADIASTVPAGLYQNEILVAGSIPSLTFDYLGTTQEDVQVCVPPPIVSAPPACGGSAGNVASILNQPASTVLWAITNGNGTITNPSTGTVHMVSLGSGGTGYAIAPAISFIGGGGSGAAAIATVTGGVITSITVTNPGSGYTSEPTVVITPNGSGSGATAVAVLGTGIVYTAGATGTVELQVTISREYSTTTAACAVISTRSVSIAPPPVITSHPSNTTVCSGTLASFSVSATDAAGYQWQVSTNGGGSWTDITGATGTTYAFTATNADTGKLYRAVVTRGPGCQVISNSALLTVACSPDLEVIQNDDTPDPVYAGNDITYTQEVKNIGAVAATNPTFTQTTPVGTTFVSMTPPAGWSCTTPAAGATGTITCTANSGTLAAGAVTGDFVLVLKTDSTVAHGAIITETATASMTEVDPTPANNSKSTTTNVERLVDVAVDKSNAQNLPPYGAGYVYTGNPPAPTPVTWTVVVTNNGPSQATNVVMTDPLPSGYSYTSANSTIGTCGYNAGTTTVTCNIGTLEAGASATITINGDVTVDSVTLTNTATVTRTEVDSNPANDSDTDYLYVIAPTEVKMLTIDAVQTKSGVTVTWQTSFEADNLGFNVHRSIAGGPLQKINKHLINGSALFSGRKSNGARSYRFKDDYKGTSSVQYFVEDVDLGGVHTMHGPVTARVGNEDEPAAPSTDPDPGVGSVGGIFESAPGIGVTPASFSNPDAQREKVQQNLAAGTNAKLVVTATGWHRVKKSDLVAAGFDPGTSSKALAVFTDGVEVPIEVRDGGDGRFDANDTIEFFATPIDLPSTGGHIYYVVSGKGTGARVKTQNAKNGKPSASNFPYTYWRNERTVFFTALNNGDAESFFGAVVTSWPVTQTIRVANLDPNGGNAELELVLQGATENFEHVVALELNGQSLGNVTFRDQQRFTAKLSVPQSMLRAGDNTLQLTALNGWDDVSVVEALRFRYAHLYRADDNALLFTIAGGSEVTVGGFTVTDVRAIDVTEPGNPIALAVKLKDGNATVVAADGQQRTILVAGATRISAPAQIVVNQPSTWNDAKQQAQLVIITNKAFLEAASALKKAREAEGIATAVIDVQNLYDEFSFGHHSPFAIRAFLQRSQQWKVAPKYAILLGDASFDPRNYYGMGAGLDFVPTKLLPMSYLKTASDDWFADFDNDGIPSIAIGRIPVRTAAEANAAVAKLIRRGSGPVSAEWAKNVDFIIDRPTASIPFASSAAQLAQRVPSSYVVRNVNLATDHPARITDAFTRGSALMNYLGHGSVEVWSNAFNSWQAANLRNGDKLPFVVAMNCLNGYFHDLFTDSLAEALMRNGNGGAIGVWASSALTAPHEQAKMNLALYDALFGASSMTVGEAVIKAKAATQDLDVRKSFVLFGDPTLRLR